MPRRCLVLLVLLLLPLVVVASLGVVSATWLTTPSGVTATNARRLQKGMTHSEVECILSERPAKTRKAAASVDLDIWRNGDFFIGAVFNERGLLTKCGFGTVKDDRWMWEEPRDELGYAPAWLAGR
jgi:hypothetical protein